MTSEVFNAFKERIQDLIPKEGVEKAIQELELHFKKSGKKKLTLIQFKTRIVNLKNEKNNGVLSHNDFDQRINAINYDFLSFLDELVVDDLIILPEQERTKYEHPVSGKEERKGRKKLIRFSIIFLLLVFAAGASWFVKEYFWMGAKNSYYNEAHDNPPKITNRRIHDIEKVLKGDCPVISKDQFYFYIDFTVNKEVWSEDGLIYLKFYKLVPKEYFRDIEGVPENLSVGKDGLVPVLIFTEYYKLRKGIQRLKVINRADSGKYKIEYGYLFNISGSGAQCGQKFCYFSV